MPKPWDIPDIPDAPIAPPPVAPGGGTAPPPPRRTGAGPASSTPENQMWWPQQVHGARASTGPSLESRTFQDQLYWEDYFRRRSTEGRPDIAANGLDQADARGLQAGLIQQLHRLAQGDRNSAAMQSLRGGFDTARGQQSSLGAMRRGLGAGAAMRDVTGQQGQISMQQAGAEDALALEQQRAAEQALNAIYQQQRQQDIGYADMLSQGAIQNRGLNDTMLQFYQGLGFGNEVGSWQREMDAARAGMGLDLEAQDIDRRRNQAWMGMIAGGAGALQRAWGGGSSRNSGSGYSSPPLVQAPYGSERGIVEEGDK